MPPPGTLIGYLDSFVVGGTTVGFDINQSGYGETNTANATIRAIPWANPPNGSHYAIVIQSGGIQPINRPYKATIYSEDDYGILRSLVGQLGILTTVREGALSAMLNSVKRGDRQDVTSPTGPQTIELEFILTST